MFPSDTLMPWPLNRTNKAAKAWPHERLRTAALFSGCRPQAATSTCVFHASLAIRGARPAPSKRCRSGTTSTVEKTHFPSRGLATACQFSPRGVHVHAAESLRSRYDAACSTRVPFKEKVVAGYT
ncbi:hypothetical protein MRX96_021497 [Rhipicephalus microplus]